MVVTLSILAIISLVAFIIIKTTSVDAEPVILISFMIYGILCLFINMVVASLLSETKIVTTTERIVASKSDTRIEGEIRGGIFYIRGRVDEVDYYFYLTDNNGVYKQEKVEVENTVIKETAGEPCIKKVKTFRTYPTGNKIALSPLTHKITESDTLFVPIGTIEATKFEVF